MRVIIAGSSGQLGEALVTRLRQRGDEVVRLVRREAADPGEHRWDPYRETLDPAILAGAGAAVNLCGAGVGDRRWNPAYKGLLQASRWVPTRVLAAAVAEAGVPVLLNASAAGYYGDRGDEEIDESTPPAEDFLGRTARRWEEETRPAAEAGARVVPLRSAHVLSGGSVLLGRMWPFFRLGLGGRFASGRQYLPWIALPDWVSAAVHAIDHDDLRGPVNLAAPTAATNTEFTAALAGVLGRPAKLPVPGFAVRAVAGEAAAELLRSSRLVPAALSRAGFTWAFPELRAALEWAVKRTAPAVTPDAGISPPGPGR